MSLNPRKWLFWMIFAAFLGALGWWACYLPFERSAVLRAIPTDAAFVSVHDNVAERWGDIAGSRLVRCLAFSAGVKADDYDKAVTDPETIKWITKLAGKRVAIAYMPSLNGSGREAWFVSSWIGGYGQRLRWMASLGLIRDAQVAGMCGRQRIWTCPVKGLSGNKKLSIAVSEGVLMCCISSLPQGVRTMVEAFDGGRIQKGISTARLSQEASILDNCKSPDRGWVAYGNDIKPFSFEIDALRGANSSGRIRVRGLAPPGGTQLKTGGLDSLAKILGDSPEILALFRSRLALRTLGLPAVPPEARPLLDVLKGIAGEDSDRRMFVSLFGGKNRAVLKSILPEGFDGLISGIPVPVIMCGIEMDDAAAARAAATAALDRLNTEYRLGLIARSAAVGDETVFAIEGTGKGAYSNLKAEERVAYTVCGGWLILSSNVEVLSRFVARYQGEDNAKALAARWLKAIGREEGPVAWAWADLDAAGVTVKDSLAMWKLSMLGDSRPEDRRLRRTLNFAMDWMDAIRPLEQGYISANQDGSVTDIRFVQGK